MQTENVNEKSALIDLFKNTYSRPSDPKLGCHPGTPGTRKSPFGALLCHATVTIFNNKLRDDRSDFFS
jgi:hypothetical protein